MTKKDLAILLSPSIAFVILAVAAFLSSSMILGRFDSAREQESQQKFERFVAKVKSGEWQLTQDKMIEGMRLAHEAAAADRQASVSICELMRDFVWLALVGIFWQLVAVFNVRKRLQKQ
jgi:hypothetical protein